MPLFAAAFAFITLYADASFERGDGDNMPTAAAGGIFTTPLAAAAAYTDLPPIYADAATPYYVRRLPRMRGAYSARGARC